MKMCYGKMNMNNQHNYQCFYIIPVLSIFRCLHVFISFHHISFSYFVIIHEEAAKSRETKRCPTSAARSPLPHTDSLNREQNSLLIDLIRQKLEAGGEIPKNLAELNARVKTGKGSKKTMWKEMAAKRSLEPDRVA